MNRISFPITYVGVSGAFTGSAYFNTQDVKVISYEIFNNSGNAATFTFNSIQMNPSSLGLSRIQLAIIAALASGASAIGVITVIPDIFEILATLTLGSNTQGVRAVLHFDYEDE